MMIEKKKRRIIKMIKSKSNIDNINNIKEEKEIKCPECQLIIKNKNLHRHFQEKQ